MHMLLADLNMERENFELSLTDYREAAKLLSAVLKVSSFRPCLAELSWRWEIDMVVLLQWLIRLSLKFDMRSARSSHGSAPTSGTHILPMKV